MWHLRYHTLGRQEDQRHKFIETQQADKVALAQKYIQARHKRLQEEFIENCALLKNIKGYQDLAEPKTSRHETELRLTITNQRFGPALLNTGFPVWMSRLLPVPRPQQNYRSLLKFCRLGRVFGYQ